MPNTPNRRTPKRSAPKAANAPEAANPAVAVAEEREPRGARRKRETRARLLDAALRLMAQKGMEGVAINEITEAADVGFGSFYNHFESKEAIYANSSWNRYSRNSRIRSIAWPAACPIRRKSFPCRCGIR